MDPATALQGFGLTLPTPAYLAGAIVFGLIGWAAYRHGKKTERPRTKWLGLGLMFYPYLVSPTWLLYMVGVALCIGVALDRN